MGIYPGHSLIESLTVKYEEVITHPCSDTENEGERRYR